jgi:hypothetical protein
MTHSHSPRILALVFAGCAIASAQDGNFRNITLDNPNGTTIWSNQRAHIAGNELLYILNKSGVIIGREWGGNGNLEVQGTIRSPGRMHIDGGEICYILNKSGVVIGKEWGGTGDLRVQGNSEIHGTISSPGRMHISGGEICYVLNRNGVIISTAWGGTGQLIVEGSVQAKSAMDVVGKLRVAGGIRTNDVVVATNVWADHVLAPGYPLPALTTVAKHIREKGHLPGIPSEAEVRRDGVDVSAMLRSQMAKIEELTLYAIAQEERLQRLEERLGKLEARLAE